jgi:hypothetical protein
VNKRLRTRTGHEPFLSKVDTDTNPLRNRGSYPLVGWNPLLGGSNPKHSHADSSYPRTQNSTLLAFCEKSSDKSCIFNPASRLQEPMVRMEHGE